MILADQPRDDGSWIDADLSREVFADVIDVAGKELQSSRVKSCVDDLREVDEHGVVLPEQDVVSREVSVRTRSSFSSSSTHSE